MLVRWRMDTFILMVAGVQEGPMVRTTYQYQNLVVMLSENQWFQMDLGPPTLVNGIVTKGRGDKKNWVTSYSVSYSNDTQIWFYYKDSNILDAKVDNESLSQNYHVSRVKRISH